MDAPMTYEGLLKLILYVFGIGALFFLILFLRNLAKIMGNLNSMIESTREPMNETMERLPRLMKNAEEISETTNQLMVDLKPNVQSITSNVSQMTEKMGALSTTVESTVQKAADTIDVVSGSIADTAYAFSSNVNTIDKYIAIGLEVLDQIKNFIKRK